MCHHQFSSIKWLVLIKVLAKVQLYPVLTSPTHRVTIYTATYPEKKQKKKAKIPY